MCFRPNDVSVAEQPLVCPACNRENAPGETTCVFCGADLPAEGPPASSGRPAAGGPPATP